MHCVLFSYPHLVKLRMLMVCIQHVIINQSSPSTLHRSPVLYIINNLSPSLSFTIVPARTRTLNKNDGSGSCQNKLNGQITVITFSEVLYYTNKGSWISAQKPKGNC
ncbi:hypothetical protein NE237_015802 [Protea cynaroides]|uniref:Uncharacterized protein n=1 Tax=Protea cynaroides TaxID=273540 RepID=A0A9Q0KEP0_9MAGN|nr:hypothetical protein NE237_015802 [Protea cynaroides]